MKRRAVQLLALGVATFGLLYFLGNHTSFLYTLRGLHGSVPPIGTLLDPYHGLWYTARTAQHASGTIAFDAVKDTVQIVYDRRGVPHIFSLTDRDAIVAFGFAIARDRLFQLDFVSRAASGNLAEVFGPSMLSTDRYLRATGMEWAAGRNLDFLKLEKEIDLDLLEWFAAGVNAHIDELEDHDLPIEFRLLGYRPKRYGAIDGLRVQALMTYDLSFSSDDASYGAVRALMNKTEYEKLFPRFSRLFVPIVGAQSISANSSVGDWLPEERVGGSALPSSAAFPGFKPGTGSNNWAVTGDRSATGGAILAGDMHLELTLPAIWYEVHFSTPSMNTYGVAVPGTPLPVEAFNDRMGWTITNTGTDQIDHYQLVLNDERSAYRYQEEWRPIELVIDSIVVRGVGVVPDTLRLTHFGPIMGWPHNPVAIQWTAHKPNKSLVALWQMHHAESAGEFQKALASWDAPMLNILYADTAGNIAIRSAGYLPIRHTGHGAGLLDGSSDAFEWTGRVDFDELPYALNPAAGYLASTNQQPTDASYPYYLRHDWYPTYRSLRINELLAAKKGHSVSDMKEYQADLKVMQRDLFVPMMAPIVDLSEDATELRSLLLNWDGRATGSQSATLVLDEYLDILAQLAWDEFDAEGVRRPRQPQLHYLLTEEPGSDWLDIKETQLMKETGPDLVRLALEATADTMRSRYGWNQASWRWDLHHDLMIRHLTKSTALRALGSGPHAYPGFSQTLSPAARRRTTHSASWRMIIDFSTNPPEAVGVYPGGQSGNPFSDLYDDQVSTFTNFGYYRLTRPVSADQIPAHQVRSTLRIVPRTRDSTTNTAR